MKICWAGGFLGECAVRIGEEENLGLSMLQYTNENPWIKANFTLSGITANETVDAGACPLTNTGIVHNATSDALTRLGAKASAT